MMKFNVFLLTLILTINISCDKTKQEAFTFIQMCDTQLGMGGYEHDVKAFELAVSQINVLNPDFVIICGDLVHNASDSSYADFKRIMGNFKVPCYPAPGNHDVGNKPNDTTLNYYRRTIGRDYYTFENNGYSFIITNTQLWKIAVENESQKHHSWFKRTLDSIGGSDSETVVIGHYPIFLENPDEEEVYFNLPLDIRKEILTLLNNNNVKAYLSGHKHETLINVHGDIQFVSGETTSKNFDDRPLGFRLWEVTKDTLIHKFVPLKIENQEI